MHRVDGNDLAAAANPQGLVDVHDNRAYSAANERSAAAIYEEISPYWASGEVDILKTKANETYQINTAATLKDERGWDKLYTEANETYHMTNAGAITIAHEEIIHGSENGQPDDTDVLTKPNEAYQIPGSAAVIDSKKNEAYGAVTEVFTKPNEAYHIPGSVAMIESKENKAYGALITSVEL